MKRLRLLTVFASLTLLTALQAPASAMEKYHLILIPNPTPQVISTIAELGLPLDDSRTIEGEGLEIPLNESEIILLESQGISYRIIQEDLEKYYQQICLRNLENIPQYTDDDPVHMKYGSMGGFYTFEEIVLDLDSMRLLYPEICAEKVILGYGWDDNPVYMVKISDNPEINEDEPEGLFDALHHAREPGAYTALMYAMWNLLENYGIDPEMTYLVDNRELYFVPAVNPDGLLYNQQTNPNGGGMWRKNRRDNGGGVYGVDLNRNYSYMWGYNNSGSSPSPSSSTYRGPNAASEPETQAMMSFTNEHEIKTGMTIHTYNDVYLCAYGYANVPPEHYDVHLDYMAYAAQGNGYGYGYCYQIMYASNGRTQDWQLNEHDIINIEPEIGSQGFWPPVSSIMPEARENQDCFMNQFWCAGGQVLFSSIRVVDGYLTPGESDELVATVFNRGWSASEVIELELSTSDPYITLTAAAASIDSIPRRESADNSSDPIIIEVDAGCPIGHQVDFTLSIDQSGYIRTEEFTLTVGTPTVYFEDDMESGIGGWTHEAVTPGWADQWHLSTANSHSAAHAWKFGDTGGGSYANSADGGLISQTINVGISGELTFWHWIEAEASGAYPDSAYDGGVVEISYNGGPWTVLPMPGYTHHIRSEAGGGNPYTGPFNPGTPVFSGSSGGWVEQTADLSAYAGDIQLRFRFGSDGGGADEGWYIDDVRLTGFPSGTTPDVAVELTPSNPPIQIPAAGGSFDFNVVLTNNEATPQTFDAWIMVTLPTGIQFGPVLGPFNLTLAGGGSLERDRTQFVPANAPSGEYIYTAYTGLYPGFIWDEDGFAFEKLSTGDGSPIGEWANTGESFEDIPDETAALIPNEMAFHNACPNPFNPVTELRFDIPQAGNVSLVIFNIQGQKIAQLIDDWYPAGVYHRTFDASQLASGIYFAQLTAGNFHQTQKLLLIR